MTGWLQQGMAPVSAGTAGLGICGMEVMEPPAI